MGCLGLMAQYHLHNKYHEGSCSGGRKITETLVLARNENKIYIVLL